MDGVLKMTQKPLNALMAGLMALGLSQAALAANSVPFPNWDLNAPAFQRAHDLFSFVSEHATMLRADDLTDKAIMARGEEALVQ